MPVPEPRRTAWWKQAKLIAAALLAVVFIVFIVQNRQAVQVQLLFATVQMPRAMLLLITLLIGCTIGFLVGTYLVARRRR